jgi:hypothetical protein
MTNEDLTRRAMLALGMSAPAVLASSNSQPAARQTDFNYLLGRWRVQHRCLIRTRWESFTGECYTQKLLDGQVILDDNVWSRNGITHRAVAIRVFDPARKAWSIFWLDTRWPNTFGPPVVGGFRNERNGVFFGEETSNDKKVRVRFRWTVESADRCRWDQAYSLLSAANSGWEVNWKMRFERITAESLTRPRW